MEFPRLMPVILSIEWLDQGREQELVAPVLAHLKNKYHYDVRLASAFNPFEIALARPDCVLLSGIEGSVKQARWANYFHEQNIPVFGVVTEGIFTEDNAEEFIWGHAKRYNKAIWTLRFLWNNHSHSIIKKHAPELLSSSLVSGNPAADKYSNRKKINSCKTVGVALTDANNTLEMLERRYPKHQQTFKNNLQEISALLMEICTQNSSINFLIRPHPGDGGELHELFYPLTKFKNVLLDAPTSELKGFLAEIDLLIVLNSSLAADASLMGISSVKLGNLNPPGNYYASIPQISSIEDFNMYLRNFQKNTKAQKNLAQGMVEATYGFSDGKNHIRIADSINECLVEAAQNKKLPFKKIKFWLFQVMVWFCIKQLLLFFFPTIRHFRLFQFPTYSRSKIEKKIDSYK